eukprot:6333066-Prymnesium_polylepis.1
MSQDCRALALSHETPDFHQFVRHKLSDSSAPAEETPQTKKKRPTRRRKRYEGPNKGHALNKGI